MMINESSNGVSLTLCKDDLEQLKMFLDSHLLIPKFGPMGNNKDPMDTWEIFSKLLRALDLILEQQKENNKNE